MRLALVIAAVVLFAAPVASGDAPWFGMGGDQGYVYYGMRDGVRSATIELDSAKPAPGGHEAVYVSAQDSRGQWLQAGIAVIGPDIEPCAYIEIMRAGHRSFDCVLDVAFGQSVAVRITASARHGYIAWINNAAYKQTTLGTGTYFVASAETYLGGTLTYRIKPAAPLPAR